jgi:hypothetical protein
MTLGLDIGTAFLVSAREGKKGDTTVIKYKSFRDGFYTITPPTKIAAAMLEKSLKGRSYFKDGDTFYLVGEEAIEKAVERNDKARRPLFRGVISPREPEARKVLKFILSKLLPAGKKEKLVYSVPAEPIDQSDEEFNTGYHQDALCRDLEDLGYEATALNEAEAICYAELEDDNYSGVSLSFGAGMVNICVMSDGEAVLKFALTRSGDWVDRMTAQSTGQTDSIIQMEKEQGDFLVGVDHKDNPILSVVSAYYMRLIDYVVQNLSVRLMNKKGLPNFSKPMPVVVSGGTSLAGGFVEAFEKSVKSISLPFKIKEVRHASEPLNAVAKGCLIAASL